MYQSTFSQLSGRITQAGEGDDVSVKHNALHYVTYGVPPQTLPQWVGGLSLQQVGSTPHLLPTHCVQYHQWYANILIALPSPLKRGRDEQRMKKGTRVRLSLRSTALRFSPPFFRDHSAPLSRRGASLPSRLSPSYGGTARSSTCTTAGWRRLPTSSRCRRSGPWSRSYRAKGGVYPSLRQTLPSASTNRLTNK